MSLPVGLDHQARHVRPSVVKTALTDSAMFRRASSRRRKGRLMSELEKYLRQARAQCDLALAAMADEHEGDVTRAVTLLASDADHAFKLVASW